MAIPENQTADLRRKNIRLFWLFGGCALLSLLSSFPFWSGVFQNVGN